jgi:dUTP pyrophosphatase
MGFEPIPIAMSRVPKYTLEILAEPEVRAHYEAWSGHHDGDSGVDLLCPLDIECNMSPNNYGIESCREQDGVIQLGGNVVKMVGMKIRCRMFDPYGRPCSYYLYPRSSMSKTPLTLANSVGIIDAGYRGEIKAAIRHTPTAMVNGEVLEKDMRLHKPCLVQICAPNLGPIRVNLVTSLDSTSRGEGGFGSTGK